MHTISQMELLKWHYHTPSGGYESPYGVEPLWTFTVGTVADGKLFVPEGHMYSPPLFHDAQQLALNITNGQVVWSIDAFDVTSGPAIVRRHNDNAELLMTIKYTPGAWDQAN